MRARLLLVDAGMPRFCARAGNVVFVSWKKKFGDHQLVLLTKEDFVKMKIPECL